jgi:hypothetical protein
VTKNVSNAVMSADKESAFDSRLLAKNSCRDLDEWVGYMWVGWRRQPTVWRVVAGWFKRRGKGWRRVGFDRGQGSRHICPISVAVSEAGSQDDDMVLGGR